MKKIGIILFVILALLLLFTFDNDTQAYQTETAETPKKTYLDTPMNNYKDQIEAQNIANSLQPPSSSYLNSRVNARVDSKKSVELSNQQKQNTDKAIEAFLK